MSKMINLRNEEKNGLADDRSIVSAVKKKQRLTVSYINNILHIVGMKVSQTTI